MNATSVDVKDILEAKQFGSFGDDLFIGREPQAPANCVTLFDSGGGEQDAKFALDTSLVQFRSRNSSYTAGYEKLAAVKLILEGKPATDVNGTHYVGFWVFTDIQFRNYDGNDRAIFIMNLRITREPANTETGNRQLIGG